MRDVSMRDAFMREPTARYDDPTSLLRSLGWIAIGSFVLGFGSYLAVGLNFAG